MSVDGKQTEWIWEFFLKNCEDGRMIHELMTALPFPGENLDIKRMFFLRSLSLQVSAGMIDELTLDILRGLGALEMFPAATRRERLPANSSCQEVSKRRKVSEYESNYDEAMNSSILQAKDGGLPSRNLEQRREFGKDTIAAQTGGGMRAWMKGRALPRTLGTGGDTDLENLSKGNTEMGDADYAGTPDGTGDLARTNFFSPDQSRKHCELELAVMLELAVKHLREGSLDRKSFESAVAKHWGDSPGDFEGWHEAGIPGMAKVRDQIKAELQMVPINPELLDGVVQKYTKARLEELFKVYLEKAWAVTNQTFLERVRADVINGKYKPVYCNGQRSKKVGTPLGDRDAGQQTSGKVDTSEKPWIRASRGQYSRSRERLQKRNAIWDIDDGDEASGATAKLPADDRARDSEKTRAEDAGGGPSQPGRDRGHDDGADLRNKMLEGGENRPPWSTEGGFEVNVRSQRFDASVARVLEFEDPSGREREGGQQECQEKEDILSANIQATEAEHPLHQTNGTGTLSGGKDHVDVTGGSPIICAPDLAELPVDSNVIDLSEDKETATTDGEKSMTVKAAGDSNVIDLFEGNETTTVDNERRTKEAGSQKKTDLQDAEPGSPHEVVNKENVVPQSSPRPTVSIPTVCFSPPPWVEGSPAVPGPEGMGPGVRRKRRHGSIQEEAGATTPKGGSSAAAAAPTTSSNQSPDTISTQRNLRRKQRVLDAVVQDPLPKILTTSRSKGSLLERNATAHTLEWEDDDDIEDSPSSSPSASRHVRLPHPRTDRKISPLVGSKTSGTMNAKNARRKPRRWSEKEVETLKREVGKFGKGRWKMILEKNLDTFDGRTEVDLKDKWRNLERFEGIRD